MEYKDPGRYIPSIYLLCSWGSRFGVLSRVPLIKGLQGISAGKAATNSKALGIPTSLTRKNAPLFWCWAVSWVA